VPAHHAVDPLDPAAAVPGEAVGFGESDVRGGARGGDEEVVEVEGEMPAREKDLDRDGGGEADARDVNPLG
jgi:hypothetical protein